ncbi:MAG: hypothetical protein E7110_01860 [Bacteroidales bacterium]|nr:hypothetical protein [Bacteroidales bacterium]
MKIIRISEKGVQKMYNVAEMISNAAESFMECLDEMQGMGQREDDEEYDEEEYYEEDMEYGQEEMGQRGSGYMGNRNNNMGNRGGSGSMGNRSGSNYRKGVMARHGDIANRRGVKGTGRYSRY